LKYRQLFALTLICQVLLCGSLWASVDSPEQGSAGALTIVSAATFRGDKLAPESITVAFGTGLATATQVAEAASLPTSLSGTQVLVKDSGNNVRTAGLFFVSPSQVNFQIPAGTAAGAAQVTLQSGDGTVSSGIINIASVSPVCSP